MQVRVASPGTMWSDPRSKSCELALPSALWSVCTVPSRTNIIRRLTIPPTNGGFGLCTLGLLHLPFSNLGNH
eukprot:2797818-Amphidinium_carterae.1